MFLGRFTLLFILFAFAAAGLLAQPIRPNKLTGFRKLNDKQLSFVDGKTLVGEVSFSGLDVRFDAADYDLENPIYESDILYALRDDRALVQPNEKLSLLTVEKAIKVLKEILFQKGYFKANVVALGKKLRHNQMRLIFSIERGPISRMSGIRFSGITNFTSEELETIMRSCLKDSWGKYDLRHIDYCAQKEVRQYMYSIGYFQAKVSTPRRKFAEDTVEIIFDVNEGIRFRIGDIKVIGTKVFDEKEILEMLGLERGDVADGKRLQDFVYTKLTHTYKDKGYLFYNAEFEPKFMPPVIDRTDGIVDIELTIEEGPLFKVRSVQFSGVDAETESELKKILSLQPGDVHNQGRIEDGIKQINELKKFRLIDLDQDAEIRCDEESWETDLLIKVTPLHRPE